MKVMSHPKAKLRIAVIHLILRILVATATTALAFVFYVRRFVRCPVGVFFFPINDSGSGAGLRFGARAA